MNRLSFRTLFVVTVVAVTLLVTGVSQFGGSTDSAQPVAPQTMLVPF